MNDISKRQFLRERIQRLIWVQDFLLDVMIEFEEAHEDNDISALLCEDLLRELELRRKMIKGMSAENN